MEDLIKNEFEFYLKFSKTLIVNLPHSKDRVLAAAWVRKIRNSAAGDEKLRINYLKLLLFVLQRRKLIGIFSDSPDKYEKLEQFPENFNLAAIAKSLLEDEKTERLDKIRKELRGEIGDHPPYSTDYSADLLEYVAAQDIPSFGVHAFYAFSKETLPNWHRAEKGIFPKLVHSTVDTTQKESAVAGSASEPCVCPQPKPDAPPEDGLAEAPCRKKLDDTEAHEKKKRPHKKHLAAPPVAPLGTVPPPDERVSPTWGSNLLEVREPYLEHVHADKASTLSLEVDAMKAPPKRAKGFGSGLRAPKRRPPKDSAEDVPQEHVKAVDQMIEDFAGKGAKTKKALGKAGPSKKPGAARIAGSKLPATKAAAKKAKTIRKDDLEFDMDELGQFGLKAEDLDFDFDEFLSMPEEIPFTDVDDYPEFEGDVQIDAQLDDYERKLMEMEREAMGDLEAHQDLILPEDETAEYLKMVMDQTGAKQHIAAMNAELQASRVGGAGLPASTPRPLASPKRPRSDERLYKAVKKSKAPTTSASPNKDAAMAEIFDEAAAAAAKSPAQSVEYDMEELGALGLTEADLREINVDDFEGVFDVSPAESEPFEFAPDEVDQEFEAFNQRLALLEEEFADDIALYGDAVTPPDFRSPEQLPEAPAAPTAAPVLSAQQQVLMQQLEALDQRLNKVETDMVLEARINSIIAETDAQFDLYSGRPSPPVSPKQATPPPAPKKKAVRASGIRPPKAGKSKQAPQVVMSTTSVEAAQPTVKTSSPRRQQVTRAPPPVQAPREYLYDSPEAVVARPVIMPRPSSPATAQEAAANVQAIAEAQLASLYDSPPSAQIMKSPEAVGSAQRVSPLPPLTPGSPAAADIIEAAQRELQPEPLPGSPEEQREFEELFPGMDRQHADEIFFDIQGEPDLFDMPDYFDYPAEPCSPCPAMSPMGALHFESPPPIEYIDEDMPITPPPAREQRISPQAMRTPEFVRERLPDALSLEQLRAQRRVATPPRQRTPSPRVRTPSQRTPTPRQRTPSPLVPPAPTLEIASDVIAKAQAQYESLADSPVASQTVITKNIQVKLTLPEAEPSPIIEEPPEDRTPPIPWDWRSPPAPVARRIEAPPQPVFVPTMPEDIGFELPPEDLAGFTQEQYLDSATLDYAMPDDLFDIDGMDYELQRTPERVEDYEAPLYEASPEQLDNLEEFRREFSPPLQGVLEYFDYDENFLNSDRPDMTTHVISGKRSVRLFRRAPPPGLSPVDERQEEIMEIGSPVRLPPMPTIEGYRTPPKAVSGWQRPGLSREEEMYIKHYVPPEDQENLRIVIEASKYVTDVDDGSGPSEPYQVPRIPYVDWSPSPPPKAPSPVRSPQPFASRAVTPPASPLQVLVNNALALAQAKKPPKKRPKPQPVVRQTKATEKKRAAFEAAQAKEAAEQKKQEKLARRLRGLKKVPSKTKKLTVEASTSKVMIETAAPPGAPSPVREPSPLVREPTPSPLRREATPPPSPMSPFDFDFGQDDVEFFQETPPDHVYSPGQYTPPSHPGIFDMPADEMGFESPPDYLETSPIVQAPSPASPPIDPRYWQGGQEMEPYRMPYRRQIGKRMVERRSQAPRFSPIPEVPPVPLYQQSPVRPPEPRLEGRPSRSRITKKTLRRRLDFEAVPMDKIHAAEEYSQALEARLGPSLPRLEQEPEAPPMAYILDEDVPADLPGPLQPPADVWGWQTPPHLRKQALEQPQYEVQFAPRPPTDDALFAEEEPEGFYSPGERAGPSRAPVMPRLVYGQVPPIAGAAPTYQFRTPPSRAPPPMMYRRETPTPPRRTPSPQMQRSPEIAAMQQVMDVAAEQYNRLFDETPPSPRTPPPLAGICPGAQPVDLFAEEAPVDLGPPLSPPSPMSMPSRMREVMHEVQRAPGKIRVRPMHLYGYGEVPAKPLPRWFNLRQRMQTIQDEPESPPPGTFDMPLRAEYITQKRSPIRPQTFRASNLNLQWDQPIEARVEQRVSDVEVPMEEGRYFPAPEEQVFTLPEPKFPQVDSNMFNLDEIMEEMAPQMGIDFGSPAGSPVYSPPQYSSPKSPDFNLGMMALGDEDIYTEDEPLEYLDELPQMPSSPPKPPSPLAYEDVVSPPPHVDFRREIEQHEFTEEYYDKGRQRMTRHLQVGGKRMPLRGAQRPRLMPVAEAPREYPTPPRSPVVVEVGELLSMSPPQQQPAYDVQAIANRQYLALLSPQEPADPLFERYAQEGVQFEQDANLMDVLEEDRFVLPAGMMDPGMELFSPPKKPPSPPRLSPLLPRRPGEPMRDPFVDELDFDALPIFDVTPPNAFPSPEMLQDASAEEMQNFSQLIVEDLDVFMGSPPELPASPPYGSPQGYYSPPPAEISPSFMDRLRQHEYTEGFFDPQRPMAHKRIKSGGRTVRLPRRAPVPTLGLIAEAVPRATRPRPALAAQPIRRPASQQAPEPPEAARRSRPLKHSPPGVCPASETGVCSGAEDTDEETADKPARKQPTESQLRVQQAKAQYAQHARMQLARRAKAQLTQQAREQAAQQQKRPQSGQQFRLPQPGQQFRMPQPGQPTSMPQPGQQFRMPQPGQLQTSMPQPAQQFRMPQPGQQSRVQSRAQARPQQASSRPSSQSGARSQPTSRPGSRPGSRPSSCPGSQTGVCAGGGQPRSRPSSTSGVTARPRR